MIKTTTYRITTLVVVIFLLNNEILAQEVQANEVADFVTNRPSVSESNGLVVPGAIQIEAGFLKSNTTDNSIEKILYNYNNTLIRIGVTEKFELRLANSFLTNRTIDNFNNTDSKVNGFSPFKVGASFNMMKQKGWIPDMNSVVYLTLQGGSGNFKVTNTTPSFLLILGNEISNIFSITNNIGVAWDGISSEAKWSFISCLDISLWEKGGIFVESFNYFPENSKAQYNCDAGIYHKITDRIQLDAAAGKGLSNGSQDYFIDLGITMRFLK